MVKTSLTLGKIEKKEDSKRRYVAGQRGRTSARKRVDWKLRAESKWWGERSGGKLRTESNRDERQSQDDQG